MPHKRTKIHSTLTSKLYFMNNNNQANHQPHLTWWGKLYYGLMLMEILY